MTALTPNFIPRRSSEFSGLPGICERIQSEQARQATDQVGEPGRAVSSLKAQSVRHTKQETALRPT